MAPRTLKDRLERVPECVPLIKDAGDPVVAGLLLALLLAAIVCLIEANDIFPSDHEARTHVIQAVGGIVVLLGAYFTANRLAFQRSQQRAEILSKLLDQIGSDNRAIRIGAIRLIERVVLELPRHRAAAVERRIYEQAIRDALETLREREDCDQTTARAISDVLNTV
jgi:hypothetical protein